MKNARFRGSLCSPSTGAYHRDQGGPVGDRRQTLRAVLHQEGGEWIAHCVDLDIVATGPTTHEAARRLAEAVSAQLDYARDEDNYAYLFHPAPPDAWQRLASAIQGKQPTMVWPLKQPGIPTALELQVVALAA